MKLIVEEVSPEEVEVISESVNGKKYMYITGPFMRSEIVNGNGRKYPLRVMENAVNKYNETYIKENRAFGEISHPSCYVTEDVEVLTKDGWKLLTDMEVGEDVYTLNTETKNVEMQKVTHVTKEPYTGKVLHIKNRTFNVSVTPDHRFPVVKRNSNIEMIFAENIIHEDAHSYIPKSGYIIKKDRPKPFVISDNIQVDFDIMCAFMGIYLSEGWCSKNKKKSNTYTISICQNEGEKADRIQLILDQFPIKFNKSIKNKKIVWRIGNKELGPYLYQFGNCYNKYIDKKLLNDMDEYSANIFLDYFVLGDGRGCRKTKYVSSDAFSTSERLIDDICQVAFIAGYATHKHVEITTKDYMFAGRIIKASNKKPLHFAQFLSTKGIYTDNRFMKIEEEENFSGNKYCITVPNGTFYARSKGYTFWSGNSPTINLDRVSHLIVSLVREGNDFIGKAKILETPMGLIAQKIMEGGGRLGVSSRGLGTLVEQNGIKIVQDDFRLATAADIVSDPSAPNAFVTGLMENAEWVFENGLWSQETLEQAKKRINEAKRHELEHVKLQSFNKLMLKLAKS